RCAAPSPPRCAAAARRAPRTPSPCRRGRARAPARSGLPAARRSRQRAHFLRGRADAPAAVEAGVALLVPLARLVAHRAAVGPRQAPAAAALDRLLAGAADALGRPPVAAGHAARV